MIWLGTDVVWPGWLDQTDSDLSLPVRNIVRRTQVDTYLSPDLEMYFIRRIAYNSHRYGGTPYSVITS
jgi:hypothetical protein